MSEYTAKDFKKGQPRWCPGCGDHFFLNSLHKSVLSLGKLPLFRVSVALAVYLII